MEITADLPAEVNNDNDGGNKNLSIHEINEKWELGLK